MDKKNTVPPMIFADNFIEHHNIAWRMEPGRKDPHNPLMEPQFPWDIGAVFSHGTVLKDPMDGLYKAWYLSTPWYYNDRQLTYAFSEDGVKWIRPKLDVYPCDGHKRTNILLGAGMGGQVSQVSVFIHPEAEPNRRYEMFCYRDPIYYRWGTPGYGNPSRKIQGLPLPAGYNHHFYGLYRHFSPDGIHWKPEGEPIAGAPETKEAYGGRPFISSDGLAVFQLKDGRYVIHNKVELPAFPGGYVKSDVGRGLCRTIARRESSDGWHWQDTYENILTPDWRDPQDTEFMELMMNEYNEGYVAAATVYHCGEGTIDIQLAGSPDGKKWFRPARRACVELEPLGEIGGGMVWPVRGFVIDGAKAHLYYAGLRGLHSDIYSDKGSGGAFHGAFCRASWEVGRMWAAIQHLDSNNAAILTTRPMECGGKTLFINALTRGSGKIEAELVSGDSWNAGKPIKGYSRKDCKVFRGDQKCAAITWKGHAQASVKNALLRFIFTDAFLYGFEWRV